MRILCQVFDLSERHISKMHGCPFSMLPCITTSLPSRSLPHVSAFPAGYKVSQLLVRTPHHNRLLQISKAGVEADMSVPPFFAQLNIKTPTRRADVLRLLCFKNNHAPITCLPFPGAEESMSKILGGKKLWFLRVLPVEYVLVFAVGNELGVLLSHDILLLEFAASYTNLSASS